MVSQAQKESVLLQEFRTVAAREAAELAEEAAKAGETPVALALQPAGDACEAEKQLLAHAAKQLQIIRASRNSPATIRVPECHELSPKNAGTADLSQEVFAVTAKGLGLDGATQEDVCVPVDSRALREQTASPY